MPCSTAQLCRRPAGQERLRLVELRMDEREVRRRDLLPPFVSPLRRRVLFTVAAAIRFAVPLLRPRLFALRLTCAYWRSRLLLQELGIRLLRASPGRQGRKATHCLAVRLRAAGIPRPTGRSRRRCRRRRPARRRAPARWRGARPAPAVPSPRRRKPTTARRSRHGRAGGPRAGPRRAPAKRATSAARSPRRRRSTAPADQISCAALGTPRAPRPRPAPRARGPRP